MNSTNYDQYLLNEADKYMSRIAEEGTMDDQCTDCGFWYSNAELGLLDSILNPIYEKTLLDNIRLDPKDVRLCDACVEKGNRYE